MAGAILDIGDLRSVADTVWARMEVVKCFAYGRYNRDIRFFVLSADVVSLTYAPTLQYAANCGAMVTNIQPVAHVLSIPINR